MDSTRKPAPKKAKMVKSAGKVMGTGFWDANGIIFIEHLERGQTLNGKNNAPL